MVNLALNPSKFRGVSISLKSWHPLLASVYVELIPVSPARKNTPSICGSFFPTNSRLPSTNVLAWLQIVTEIVC